MSGKEKSSSTGTGSRKTSSEDSKLMYASKPATFERTKSKAMNIAMKAVIASLFFMSLGLIVVGGVALLHCVQTYYATYTPVAGAVLLIGAALAMFSVCKDYRMLLMCVAVLNLMVCLFLIVYESLAIMCTAPGPTTKLCQGLRINANFCRRTMNSVDWSNNDVNNVPEDSYRGGRIAVMFFICLAFITCIVLIILFVIANQLTGSAVYLHRKRHKSALVVGDLRNVELAFMNEEKNFQLIMPTADEWRAYDEKRERFGGKKLITSTLAPLSADTIGSTPAK